MKPLSRKGDEKRKPVEMTYDGDNGPEVLEWARDDNTSSRFQWRPGIAPEDVRVLLNTPHIHWEIVPVGATIRLQPDGDLELVLPQPKADLTKEEA
jgi:hypothetical protein